MPKLMGIGKMEDIKEGLGIVVSFILCLLATILIIPVFVVAGFYSLIKWEF